MPRRKLTFEKKMGMLASLPLSLVVSALVLGSFSLIVSAWMISFSNPGHLPSSVLGDQDERDENENEEEEEEEKEDDDRGNEEEEKEEENEDEDSEDDKDDDPSDSSGEKGPESYVAEQRVYEDVDDEKDEADLEIEDKDELDDYDDSHNEEEEEESKDERTRLDYRVDQSGNIVRYRYEYRDGEIKIKVESKDGETEYESNDESGVAKYKVQVQGEDVDIDTDDDSLVFVKRKVRASTAYPLSVDPETGELIVTTPSGVKMVSVLPDVALENFVSVDDLVDEFDVDLVANGDGVLVYRSRVEYKKKFLGLIPVTIEADTEVSAEDGSVIMEDKSFGDSLLSLFSF